MGSTQRQATTGLGRSFRGAFVTRGASSDADGSGASSPSRVGTPAALLLFALTLLLFAPAADAAQQVVFNQFGTEAGGEAGQIEGGAGLAVNRSGAGGVDPGDVYVVEASNNRVSEFDRDGDFVRAWGWDVVSSGPGDAGDSFEICEPANGDTCRAGFPWDGAGGLKAPRGVAVDQDTGNVFVAEANSSRVSVFSAEGEFQGAFGWNVNAAAPAAELQFCTTSTGCQGAVKAESAGGFWDLDAGALAVDPSNGNLWVGDEGNRRINEFSFTLNVEDEVTAVSFERALGWNVNAEAPAEELQECTTATDCQEGTVGPGGGQFDDVRGIAVDSTGHIYATSLSNECGVTTPCQVHKLDPDGSFEEFFGPSFGGESGCQLTWTNGGFGNGVSNSGAVAQPAYGIAIDPTNQHVFLTRKTAQETFEICEFDPDATLQARSPSSPLPATTSPFPNISLAIGNERVYAQAAISETEGPWPVTILGTVPAPGAEVSGISDVTATSATLEGNVTVPKPGGTGFNVAYHFEYSRDGLTWTRTPIEDAFVGPASGPYLVQQKVSGLLPNFTYRVRLVATTSFTTTSKEALFTTQEQGPRIVEQRPVGVEQTTATLQARINPLGSATTYHFEWGPDGSFGNRIPADHELFAGSGHQLVKVSANLSGLQPVSRYNFRVVATNSKGTTVGPDHRFETLNEAGLPNNRGPELVSPADKGSSGSVSDLFLFDQVLPQASEDGDAFVYPIQNGLPESTSGGWTRWRAERTGSGWLSSQVSAPSLIPPPGSGFFAEPSRVLYETPDLSCAIIRTYNPLTEDTPQQSVEEGVENLYRRNQDGSFDLITNRMPLNDGQSGFLYRRIDASDDCSRVFFESTYTFISGASRFYEWDEGTLRDAGVRPDGSVGPDIPGGLSGSMGALPGGELETIFRSTARWNSVTPEGSLFFTAISNEGLDSGTPAVFMREDGGAVTPVDISQSQTAVATQGARFEAASADGGRVIFRANYGIADTSSAEPMDETCGPLLDETEHNTVLPVEEKACDLYAYDVESEELTDISVGSNPTPGPIGAAIQGVVAVDEDGSHVYFAALGQLIEGKGRSYAQNIAGEGSANIYLSAEGGLSYVTTLERGSYLADNNGDLLGGALMRKADTWTAEASADGNRLLFESEGNLTGYDSGGVREAYVYSADTDELVCISCRPDGQPALASVPDRRLAKARFTQTYRPRRMSGDGSRVFFTSPDVLASGAVAGKRNVYQWENGQLHLLVIVQPTGANGIGEYLDTSASGDDVFIATGDQLVPQDRDFVADVYDFRVDGGFPVEPPPIPCDPAADECQGVQTPQPVAPSPASTGFSGPGNPPESKPRPKACPKGKVRKRGKCVKRPHRGAKSKRGRAANGNRGGVK